MSHFLVENARRLFCGVRAASLSRRKIGHVHGWRERRDRWWIHCTVSAREAERSPDGDQKKGSYAHVGEDIAQRVAPEPAAVIWR